MNWYSDEPPEQIVNVKGEWAGPLLPPELREERESQP